MEENSFNVNLTNMNEIFNNKTFNYRINGFAYACRIENIEVLNKITSNDKKTLRYNQVLFGQKKNNKDEIDYFFTVTTGKDDKHGDGVTLNGYYGDLNFSFTNYYKIKDLHKLDKKVLELPFSISLTKKIDKFNYKLDIETVEGIRTRFTINKYREHKNSTLSYQYTFYSNIMDFSSVLKLVKSFVYNPELVFMTYDEEVNSKKIVLTNSEVNKGLMKDANLDKPVGKVKKIIKTIID